jgi:hypothetical protein
LKAHFVVFKTYQFFIAEKCKNKLIPAIWKSTQIWRIWAI